MTHPTIAAIVPVYNRPKLVLEALDSIAAQTLPPTELIVVDDGSTDDTASSVRQWMEAARPGFATRLICQRNAGCGQARNNAVAKLTGCDLLAFLDSDDLWPVDYLRRMTDAMSRRDEAVAASCDRKVIYCSDTPDHMYCAKSLDGRATAEIFDGYCPNPSSTVVTTAAFNSTGGFDPDLEIFEDQDLWLRLSLLGPWVYVPGDPVVFRQGMEAVAGGPANLSQRMTSAEGTLMHLRMLSRFLDKYGGSEAVPPRRRRHRTGKILYLAGEQYRHAGQKDKALQYFARAIKVNPFYRRALTRWVRTRVSMLLHP